MDEFFNPKRHTKDIAELSNAEKDAELKLLRVRFQLASGFVDLLRYAYDALLHYGVNYKNLPAYKDEALLDEARKLPASQGFDKFVEWMARVKHDIRAAINRKGFRKL